MTPPSAVPAPAPPADAAAVPEPETDKDRGRGLYLIKALSENVRMQSTPRSGSLIHFEKAFAAAP